MRTENIELKDIDKCELIEKAELTANGELTENFERTEKLERTKLASHLVRRSHSVRTYRCTWFSIKCSHSRTTENLSPKTPKIEGTPLAQLGGQGIRSALSLTPFI